MVVPVGSRESYRGGGGGSGGAVRVVLRLVRRRWRGREGKVALEVTRPEEKVGVAGVTTGGSSGSSTPGLVKQEESVCRMLVGHRSRSRRLLTESLILDRVPREYQRFSSRTHIFSPTYIYIYIFLIISPR